MSKNKTTTLPNRVNTSNNINNNNTILNAQKTQVGQNGQNGQIGSTVAKAGLDSIMGQKLLGPKISTVKR